MAKALCIILVLLMAENSTAQQKISFDVAAIRNIRHSLNGSNLSCFYHFNENLVGGLEMNRFFPVKQTKEEKTAEYSAWDLDLNFHYLLPTKNKYRLYPLCGISHTAEKESPITAGETHYENFWSFNTGGGVLYELGKWSPHIEYSFTWGHINQQFLLAGISYELK
jgi:hypothetical protein